MKKAKFFLKIEFIMEKMNLLKKRIRNPTNGIENFSGMAKSEAL